MKALWKTKSRAELMADKVADYGREPNKYNYRIKNCSFSDLRCWWTRRWWWSPSTTGLEHLASSQQTHPGEDWQPILLWWRWCESTDTPRWRNPRSPASRVPTKLAIPRRGMGESKDRARWKSGSRSHTSKWPFPPNRSSWGGECVDLVSQ